MSHLRRYTYHQRGGRKELVAWIQNRCGKCGRFLTKRQTKYCKQCKYPALLEYERELYRQGRKMPKRNKYDFHKLRTQDENLYRREIYRIKHGRKQ